MSVVIALLSSAAAGGAVHFWGSAEEKAWGTWGVIVGMASFGIQIGVWLLLTYLVDKKDKEGKEEKIDEE